MENYSQQEITPLTEDSNVEIKPSFDQSKPFWQRIVEIGQQVPKEEWDKLPKDFARNFEHYMYGAPKEEGKVQQKHLEALLVAGLDSGELVEVTDEWWEQKRTEMKFYS